MPGIIPMKVIKLGSTAQSRIAQACDRCRSKKIRCDGITPSCTQCLNVGFECKTSDKLSRRAFPRGYTESLEERVRTLEAEIRELKGLLDEKEEKIDMMCKVRSGSMQSHRSPKRSPELASRSGSISNHSDGSNQEADDFRISQSPILVHEDHSNAYSMGNSSARSLICAYKFKAQQNGKLLTPLDVNAFFPKPSHGDVRAVATRSQHDRPARMLTDRLVNIYFQEFAPLFPVLHRPTFLKLYDDFVSGATPPPVEPQALAQLYLVFGIAALSTQRTVSKEELDNIEAQWTIALEAFDAEESLVNAQCLTLATLYFMKRAEYPSMLKYKGHAVAITQRLGLHRSQTSFTYDPLVKETRKKTFWTLFTLDSFSAAHLGLPALFACDDAECEYPVDADDEYVTEKGFMPTLPGESTKLSSAIALFRLSKVLSKILRDLYPAAATYQLSYRTIAALQDELDVWSTQLAMHLRLHFENDKPSTRIVSDRSPLLSFAFHYIRSLLAKPIILSASQSHDRSSSSILSLSSSSKKIIQISDLLEERSMAFAFCLNENEILLQAVFGLLLESVEVGSASTVHKENIKLSLTVAQRFKDQNALGKAELGNILTVWAVPEVPQARRSCSSSTTSSASPPEIKEPLHRRGLKAIANRLGRIQEKSSRSDSRSHEQRFSYNMSSPNNTIYGTQSHDSRTPMFARSESSLSPQHRYINPTENRSRRRNVQTYELPQAYDNLSISTTYETDESSPKDWQKVLSNLDSGHNNIYDVIYGGPGASATSLVDYSSIASSSPEQPHHDNLAKAPILTDNNQHQPLWSPEDSWNLSSNFATSTVNIPTSVLSFSSDETTSLDDLGDITFPPQMSTGEYSKSIVIPGDGTPPLMGISNETGWIPGLDPLFNV